MIKIAHSVYANLSPRQRVVACIEALAREDDTEMRLLTNSCPKVTCQETDPRFTERMENLMGIAMAVEADKKESALRYFAAHELDPKNAECHLQNFANTSHAWLTTLTTLGIDEQSMALVGPPSSPTFELLEGLMPEPDTKHSEALAAEIIEVLGL